MSEYQKIQKLHIYYSKQFFASFHYNVNENTKDIVFLLIMKQIYCIIFINDLIRRIEVDYKILMCNILEAKKPHAIFGAHDAL